MIELYAIRVDDKFLQHDRTLSDKLDMWSLYDNKQTVMDILIDRGSGELVTFVLEEKGKTKVRTRKSIK